MNIPKIYPMEIDNLPLPRKIVLSNGVPLYVMQGGTPQIVRLDLLFKGGYAIQQQPLQALFTNRMLREGTEDFTSDEISQRLDFCGAWVEMYSSQNCNHITLHTLRKHLSPLLSMLESMLKRPLFPQTKLENVRSSNKAYFEVSSGKVGNVSQRHMEQMLWGEQHPLGHIVTVDDYDAITRDCLQYYHRNVYSSETLTLFMSGGIDDASVAEVEKYFGSEQWGSGSLLSSSVLPSAQPILGRRKVSMPGVMQSGVKIGCMVMNADSPDFLKFRFTTVLFGGYFGSRLMSNIRERNGYTYHIEACLDEFGSNNALVITSETANEYVDKLIGEVYAEMASLRTKPVSEEELSLVRNYTMGELCREYEGVSAKAEVFINMWLSGMPFEAVNEYLDVIRTISAGDIQEMACKYLLPQNMSEVVVAP